MKFGDQCINLIYKNTVFVVELGRIGRNLTNMLSAKELWHISTINADPVLLTLMSA